ncbi:MAG: FlgO family outer membrane protein [Candidatus Hadarchaeum sp.]
MSVESCVASQLPSRLRFFAAYTAVLLAVAGRAWGQGYDQEMARLSAAVAEQVGQAGKKTIAVIDFTDLQGNVTELGRFLAEELSASLAGTRRGFEVIDRNNLRLIMQEQKLAASGVMDPATIKKLGQIAGADALASGTTTPFGETVRVFIKILDTATAKVVGAARGDIPRTKAIDDLLGRSVIASGASIAGALGAVAPSAPKGNLPLAEADGIVFAVQGCRVSGSTLVCTILATSREDSRRLSLCGRGCFAVDDLANEYQNKEVSLGVESSKWGSVSRLIFADVPTKIVIKFSDFSQDATSIVGLTIRGEVGSKDFLLIFRGIPVSR